MKYPTNSTALIEARMYAIESINHTMDYDGWSDGHAKAIRLMTGNYCQLWLAEFCDINNIPCEKDRSSPYIADKGDATINQWVIDSKASIIDGLEGQISPHHDDMQKEIDYYAFFKVDRQLTYIEPMGFIRSADVVSASDRVNKGENIPGTNIPQRFSYSYFVRRTEMQPFIRTLHELKNESKAEYEAKLLHVDYSNIVAEEDTIPF